MHAALLPAQEAAALDKCRTAGSCAGPTLRKRLHAAIVQQHDTFEAIRGNNLSVIWLHFDTVPCAPTASAAMAGAEEALSNTGEVESSGNCMLLFYVR